MTLWKKVFETSSKINQEKRECIPISQKEEEEEEEEEKKLVIFSSLKSKQRTNISYVV